MENDDVVMKTMQRYKDPAHSAMIMTRLRREHVPVFDEYCRVNMPNIEETEAGYMILPDSCDGWGPMYFSLLQKLQGKQ